MAKTQWLLAAAGLLALGVGVKLAGVSAPEPAMIAGLALTATVPYQEVVMDVTVVQRRRAKDGRQLLTVQTNDGVQTLVYVSDDARAEPAAEGDRIHLRATVISAGGKFLTAVKPRALTRIDQASTEPEVLATVRAEVAYIDGTERSVPAPEVPDGDHVGTVHSFGEQQKFVVTARTASHD